MSYLEMALSFWREVQKTFPHKEVQLWIDSLESGKADWFRNYSLSAVASSAHSTNSKGRWSYALHEENTEKLNAIAQKHEVTRLMQW